MSILDGILGLADRVRAPRAAHAHCDIPCGIYDPHGAQVAALTVIRMVQLMQALPGPEPNSGKDAIDVYAMQMSRYSATKEEHARLCEHELVILWSDYFKPEHLAKYPDLHTTFWNTMKLTSSVKTGINADAAQQLLAGCQQIAEIFWDTKGVKTHRQATNQGAAGGEFVYPSA
jgi:nickel superoxide dismutase